MGDANSYMAERAEMERQLGTDIERIEHEVTSRNSRPSEFELAAWCNEKLAARYPDVVVHTSEDGDSQNGFAKQFKHGTLMAQLLQVCLQRHGRTFNVNNLCDVCCCRPCGFQRAAR